MSSGPAIKRPKKSMRIEHAHLSMAAGGSTSPLESGGSSPSREARHEQNRDQRDSEHERGAGESVTRKDTTRVGRASRSITRHSIS